MHLAKLLRAPACLFILLHFWNCSGDIQPTQFDKSTFPDPPLEIRVAIADGKIVLSWSHPNPQGVDFYNIYRQSDLDTVMTLIDTTSSLTYTDSNVNNGVTYNYAVAAVKDGFEGAKANSAAAVPSVFGVIINSGDEFSNSRSVVLTLIAPVGTTFMRISNDSLFTSAQWEPYVSTKMWTITEQDGLKTVYAHFRDARENETLEPHSDSITLDTKANILEVTENTGGQTKSAGEIIHFSLTSGETKGSASVDIGQARTNIKLFDDATNGDDVADDGIYHRDFKIPVGLEVTDASIMGHFTDRLGNVAETKEADGLVTIQNPPAAVTLLDPEQVQGSTTSLRISWTQSAAQDFASYKLYRSLTPNVTTSSTFVTSIESISTLSHIDNNLEENTSYYYRLYVFDSSGLHTGSNEVNGTTPENEPPEPVTLSEPETTEEGILLRWSQNNDSDFSSYKIFRAKVPGVNTSSKLVTVISSRSTITYEDKDVEENTLYFYRVFVFDAQEGFSGSNEVSITSAPNEPPEPVTLAKPSQVDDETLRLNWAQSTANDFASYRIYRSELSPVDTTEAPIIILNNDPTITTYDDTGLQINVQYYYRIFVFDKGGLSAGSNEVMGRLN